MYGRVWNESRVIAWMMADGCDTMTRANNTNKILGVDAKNDNDRRASRTIDVTMGAAMGLIDDVMMCGTIYDVTIGEFTIGAAQVKMGTIGAKDDTMDATIGAMRGAMATRGNVS